MPHEAAIRQTYWSRCDFNNQVVIIAWGKAKARARRTGENPFELYEQFLAERARPQPRENFFQQALDYAPGPAR